MSFNSIYKQKNSLSKQLFTKFLEVNENSRLDIVTQKDKSIFESDTIQWKERIATLKESLNDKSAFQEATLDSFNEDRDYIKMLHTEITTSEDYYLEKAKLYQNVLSFEKQKINSKLRELKAKLNTLKGSTGLFSFVFKESFINYYSLNNLNNTTQTLDVDIETELATLPVDSRESVKVKAIFIGADSNGKVGDESGKHKNVFNLTKDNNAKLEYFKYGEANLKLELNFKFSSLDIVNEILIKKSEVSASSSLEVEDILFETNGGKEISINQLCDTSKQSLEIDSLNKSELKIKFLPIECLSFSIHFKSKDYSIVNGRKKHGFGLKYVEINKLSYSSSGEIASNIINFPNRMNFLEGRIHSLPQDITKQSKLSIYQNNYSQSQEIKPLQKELLDNATNMSYRFLLDKQNVSLKDIDAYKVNNNFFNGKYISKIFNKDLNPNTLKIERNAANVKVLQYDLCKRSNDEEDKITIGYINGSGVSKINLPVDLKDSDSDVKVYINNKEVSTQVTSKDLVVNEDKFFIEDSKNLYVYSNDTYLKEVSFLLNVKKLTAKKSNSGYYLRIEEDFDFSKNQIKVYSHLEELTKEIELEKNVSKFSIEENISSYEIIVYENSSWREATTAEFSFNLATGILNIDSSILNLEKRINIKYSEKNRIKDFEIWKKDQSILGVFLKEENVNVLDNKDLINLNNVNVIELSKSNIIENSVVFEKDFFSLTGLEEVAYINGSKEFKNIQKIEKDLIPAFEVTNQQVTFFTLSTVHTEDGFTQRVKVFNENDIEVTGLTLSINQNSVTISGIQESSIENWYLEYYTILEEEAGPRISINYKEGIIYISQAVNVSNKYVYYQSGLIEVEYDLCRYLTSFEYFEDTGLVEIYLEEASNFNNKIKIIWEDNESLFNLDSLKKYYSPLIYEISFGVN